MNKRILLNCNFCSDVHRSMSSRLVFTFYVNLHVTFHGQIDLFYYLVVRQTEFRMFLFSRITNKHNMKRVTENKFIYIFL